MSVVTLATISWEIVCHLKCCVHMFVLLCHLMHLPLSWLAPSNDPTDRFAGYTNPEGAGGFEVTVNKSCNGRA